MIPKTIHYLWLSDEKPEDVLACLDSWKQHLKGYEIIEWNKTNFPYNDFIWTKEAFSVQKWAFVTDFFRLWVLKNYGGIYLDADVIVRKNFNEFLDHKLFIGTEWMFQLEPHAIGAEPNHPFIVKCLEYYEDRHFIFNGKNDMTPMPFIITKIFMKEYNYSDSLYSFAHAPLQIGDIAIYDDSYFTINVYNGNNICYHNCFGAWRDKNTYDTPTLQDFVKHYSLVKFFTNDIFKKKGFSKYMLLLLPSFIFTLYYKWHIKIKNNKRVKLVKYKSK